MHIQLPDEFRFLAFGIEIPLRRPVNIIDCSDPYRPEFIFWLSEAE